MDGSGQEGSEIRGYPSHWRTFWQLKTDGTEEGTASVRFEGEVEALEPSAFEVDGQPVSETEYEAAVAAQAQKQDAVWYKLNEANISHLTA